MKNEDIFEVVARYGETRKLGSIRIDMDDCRTITETITTLQAKIQELWDERRQILVDAGSDEFALIARCEAAEQALEGMRSAAVLVLKARADFKTFAEAGVMRGLLPYSEADLRKASLDGFAALEAALNPTPQGGKP